MMKCLLCQTLNNPNSRFCSGCGAQFTGEAPPPIKKNSLSTPVIIIIVVIALCGLCGLCSRASSDRNRSVSAPIPTPANASTYAPSAFASTNSANSSVNTNTALPPPVARKKKIRKKPPVVVTTTESLADGEDSTIDSDAEGISETESSGYSAPAQRSVSAPKAGGSNGYYTGPRGGCYTYSASGKKRYVDRSLCN